MIDYYKNLVSFIINTNTLKESTKFLLIGSSIIKTTKPLISKVEKALIKEGTKKNQIFVEIFKEADSKKLEELVYLIEKERFDHTIIFNEEFPGEANFRKVLRQEAIKCGTFSDMPFASEGLIRLSFKKNYQQIRGKLLPIYKKLKKLRIIRVTSKQGTNLTIEFSRRYRWINSNGHVSKTGMEKDVSPSGNLFPAEFYTHPSDVNGTLVADSFYLPALQLINYNKNPYLMHETLKRTPIIVKIKKGRITDLVCKNNILRDFIFNEVFKIDIVNGARIGEFAFPGLFNSTKEFFNYPPLLEKIKVHLAHGHGYGEKTGCLYDSPVHGDFGLDESKITDLLTGKVIFESGFY